MWLSTTLSELVIKLSWHILSMRTCKTRGWLKEESQGTIKQKTKPQKGYQNKAKTSQLGSYIKETQQLGE